MSVQVPTSDEFKALQAKVDEMDSALASTIRRLNDAEKTNEAQNVTLLGHATRLNALEGAPPEPDPKPEPEPEPEPEPQPEPEPIPGKTIFEWDGKSLSQWRSELPNGHEAEALSVVDDPVNPGRKAIQTRQDLAWGQDQNGKYRVEIKAPNGIFLEDGKEYVIEWETFMADNENNRNLIAMDKPNCSHCQFHNMDVTGTSQIHYRAGSYVGNFGMYGSENLGKINLGAWDKIKIHVKVSTKGDGFCKIWLNSDQPVYSKTGQNLKTGDSRLNLKYGVYCGSNEWVNVTYRRQLYSAFKITLVS